MTDQLRASRAADKALELWSAGEAESAVPFYQEALQFADPENESLPDYQGAYAGVLATLGRNAEALEQYKLAIAGHLRSHGDEQAHAVVIARYFLGQFFLNQGQPQQAMDAVEPSLEDSGVSDWLLRWVRALAYQDMGRTTESAKELERALQKAPSDAKREELTALYAETYPAGVSGQADR